MDVQTAGSSAIQFVGPAAAVAGGASLLFLKNFLSYQHNKHQNGGGNLPSVPEIPGLPLLGNLLQLKDKKPYKTFTKWADTYGPIYSIKMGATSVVVLNSNDLAKEAFVTRFDSISTKKVSKALKILTADKSIVAMSDYDDYHKTIKRNILTSLLGPDALKKHRLHRDTLAENLSNQLHDLASNSHQEAVNLRNIFQSELLTLALKQTFGRDLESIYVDDLGTCMTRDEVFQVLVLDPMMGAIDVDWRDFFPYLSWIPNENFEKKLKQMYVRREAVMKSLIQEHRKRICNGENLNSFIDYLLSEAQPLTEKQLLMSLWEPIIESSDTTMVTIEWAMYELAKNPKKQARLYEEIQSVCGGEKITEEKLCKMPYLSAVFQETLRRHSPVSLIPLRYVHENTELGGYHIPSGTELAINIYGCNMEREIWKDPSDWNPERYLSENEPIDLHSTMAFGGGKRVCSGAMQAMLVACASIGRMIHEFEWSLKDDTGEDVSTLGLTTQKLNPMLAIIKPRNKQYKCTKSYQVTGTSV